MHSGSMLVLCTAGFIRSPTDGVYAIAALLGYPKTFTFPTRMTERQSCALLGNGLSLQCTVPIVRYLLCDFLVSGSTDQ